MARLAQIDARIEAAQLDRIPRLEAVAELLADTRRLWARALPHERRQLLAPLLDRVTVCMETKRLVEVIPKRSLAQFVAPGRRS